MTRIEWPGIPETYWPDTETPWRVTFGLGAFEDFSEEQDAVAFAAKLREDGMRPVSDPFDATKVAP